MLFLLLLKFFFYYYYNGDVVSLLIKDDFREREKPSNNTAKSIVVNDIFVSISSLKIEILMILYLFSDIDTAAGHFMQFIKLPAFWSYKKWIEGNIDIFLKEKKF